MRTIVLSDCHGHPQLVTAALEDAGFVNGRDRLVFAGDFLDRGPLPAACLEVLEEAGAEMLLGNHDAAILLGQQIWPQDGVSWTFRGRLLEGFAAGAWQLVAAAHGVLVSHAGVVHPFAPRGADDADELAAALNARFRVAVLSALRGRADDSGLLGDFGPLWLRPRSIRSRNLPEVPQVVGHTDPSRVDADELAGLGVHMIDPGVGSLRPGEQPRTVRYAVIDERGARVHHDLLPAVYELAAS